jgi:hypothetical protein
MLCIALFVGQSQIPQNQDVIRLAPHVSEIPASDGGKTVELFDAAPLVLLPKQPPHIYLKGAPWFVDVRNLGPSNVTLQGSNGFTVHIMPNETVRIRTAGTVFAVTRR